jgi:hypothetical protein
VENTRYRVIILTPYMKFADNNDQVYEKDTHEYIVDLNTSDVDLSNCFFKKPNAVTVSTVQDVETIENKKIKTSIKL